MLAIADEVIEKRVFAALHLAAGGTILPMCSVVPRYVALLLQPRPPMRRSITCAIGFTGVATAGFPWALLRMEATGFRRGLSAVCRSPAAQAGVKKWKGCPHFARTMIDRTVAQLSEELAAVEA